ncbi:hypothetical protein WJ59_23185 [Burkholderia gladioli]|uniref:hypothetical protein n=1 Tax=Burkholderia gladioli TaxID=28095 RepID=UPI000755232D|nr:hypothetical protein [Burkholderia gladioli]KVM63072.1 hypothetical protein WJ59_23185 [Burkholderia gladioli]
MKRRQLSKAQLLPLPADYQRRMQLRHHLALASLRAGQASPEQLALLLSTIQIAYLLRAPSQAGTAREADQALFSRAERTLEQCYARLSEGAPVLLHEHERGDLERIVTDYDARLVALPAHRYADAQAELHHHVFTGRSPIPAQRSQAA